MISHVSNMVDSALVSTDDVTADRNSNMNYDLYSAILCSHSAKCIINLTGQRFTVQMDNDLKMFCRSNSRLSEGKEMGQSSMTNSAA